MKLTKRILAFLLALTLLVSTLCVSAVAEADDVATATAAIAALPDFATITDPDSTAYADAVAAAWDAVYALAECTQEELLSIADYHKPFDMLFDLLLLPANVDGAPTTIPASEEEVMQQAAWVANISDVLNAVTDQYSVIDEYTTGAENGEPYGSAMLSAMVEIYYVVAVRIEAYISTLPKDEQAALEQKVDELFDEDSDLTDATLFAQKLAIFPDEFTEENLMDYIVDFHDFSQEVEYGWYDLTAVNQEDLAKYERLATEFEVVIGIHHAAMVDKLEDRINQVCDLEKARTASPLKKRLCLEAELYELGEAVYAVQETLGCYTDSQIENLGLFYEYYDEVLGYSYEPSFEYGDVDEDGDVTAADALLILQTVVGKYYLTESQELAADVDENADISAEDALNILKYIVGKVDFLPIIDYTTIA